MRKAKTGATIVLALLLAACGSPPTTTTRNDAVAMAPSPTPTPSPSAAPSLTRFVGKYPFDKVGGTRFLDEPGVRAAVAASGAGKPIADLIFGGGGPQTPIVLQAGRVLSWGCEAHDCGAHQWSVAVAPDGASAEICYYDEDEAKVASWFAGGKLEMKADAGAGCPSGDAS